MQYQKPNNFLVSFLPNEIIRIEIIAPEELDGEDVAEILREVDPYYEGNKLPLLLVVIPTIYAISFSAMREAKSNRGAKRMAVISKSKSMRKGLQIAFRVVRLHFPISFFDDEESGKEWLLKE